MAGQPACFELNFGCWAWQAHDVHDVLAWGGAHPTAPLLSCHADSPLPAEHFQCKLTACFHQVREGQGFEWAGWGWARAPWGTLVLRGGGGEGWHGGMVVGAPQPWATWLTPSPPHSLPGWGGQGMHLKVINPKTSRQPYCIRAKFRVLGAHLLSPNPHPPWVGTHLCCTMVPPPLPLSFPLIFHCPMCGALEWGGWLGLGSLPWEDK
jgi:hypothetical protein